MMPSDLEDRWRAGDTLRQIAEATGKTRNSVAGAVHRARSHGEEFLKRPPVRKLKPVDEGVKNRRPDRKISLEISLPATAPEQVFIRTLETDIPPPRLLIDIPWNGCRMPVDQRPPPDNRHLMCGRPRAGRGSYCATCSAKVSVSRPSAAGQTR
jgi:hypothetical protein